MNRPRYTPYHLPVCVIVDFKKYGYCKIQNRELIKTKDTFQLFQ